MKRNLKEISRFLDDDKNSDIINKKSKLMKMFNDDPDLLDILGERSIRPLNKFEDENNPTKDELELRKEINEYNSRIKHDRIVPYIKLNGIQKEVVNFIMYDINDHDIVDKNVAIKTQYLIVVCLVHEDDMDTEYRTEDGLMIPRTDLLDYIVKDLLCWTNFLGNQLVLENDFYDIIDSKYYARTLKFRIKAPNNIQGGGNKYDRFKNI